MRSSSPALNASPASPPASARPGVVALFFAPGPASSLQATASAILDGGVRRKKRFITGPPLVLVGEVGAETDVEDTTERGTRIPETTGILLHIEQVQR